MQITADPCWQHWERCLQCDPGEFRCQQSHTVAKAAETLPPRSAALLCPLLDDTQLEHRHVACRENTEGEYSGLEHEVVPDVVESLKVRMCCTPASVVGAWWWCCTDTMLNWSTAYTGCKRISSHYELGR